MKEDSRTLPSGFAMKVSTKAAGWTEATVGPTKAEAISRSLVKRQQIRAVSPQTSSGIPTDRRRAFLTIDAVTGRSNEMIFAKGCPAMR